MIKLSKKAEYALRAICAMARNPSTTTFQIQELAANQHIPPKFLEQILLSLRKGGILDSKRGVGGGYRFQRPIDRISVGELIALADGSGDLPDCAYPHPNTCVCGVPGGCGMGRFFSEFQTEMNQKLHNTSIADLLAKERRLNEMSFEI